MTIEVQRGLVNTDLVYIVNIDKKIKTDFTIPEFPGKHLQHNDDHNWVVIIQVTAIWQIYVTYDEKFKSFMSRTNKLEMCNNLT